MPGGVGGAPFPRSIEIIMYGVIVFLPAIVILIITGIVMLVDKTTVPPSYGELWHNELLATIKSLKLEVATPVVNITPTPPVVIPPVIIPQPELPTIVTQCSGTMEDGAVAVLKDINNTLKNLHAAACQAILIGMGEVIYEKHETLYNYDTDLSS